MSAFQISSPVRGSVQSIKRGSPNCSTTKEDETVPYKRALDGINKTPDSVEKYHTFIRVIS